ncbi:CDP-alcohol phosphatidyltransferase-domain-containing protein [Lipomyces tetrasporus]|uniref:CDP-diacylglycerol--inositol 3-phosphatidyltransferase n=1 Tax=Lipomyces tetrasporus TaxID=54092 RepID=A0AAD7VTP0_9ASCO|nr:CDP-alcohol phosphatidyltransferase-domain-containing protein [Lipomyces tetrasporus]KAJ8101663.1 CDP-alcohol phosphatidyltransferase-domain-containing protein [Lipomyces tetrasporus]
MAAPKPITTTTVFLFIPNLIGYARVILALSSLAVMRWYPKICTWLYILSCLLDAFDGLAARKFNQSTKFGAILDMVTDRCTTSCLICFLSSAYPKWAIFYQLLISLDLASHYMHMFAMLSSGQDSHKKVGKERGWFLNLYYTNRTVLFIFCAANELFFVALYLCSFPPETPPYFGSRYGIPISYATIMAVVTFPIWLGKQLTNVIQMVQAAQLLAQVDVEERNGKLAAANAKNK